MKADQENMEAYQQKMEAAIKSGQEEMKTTVSTGQEAMESIREKIEDC